MRIIPDVAQTIVATINQVRARYDHVFTTGGIDRTEVPSGGSLVVGLFGGVTEGSGEIQVSLSVTENGAAVSALSFTNESASQARASFADMAFNLGALSGSGTLALNFVLSVTSDTNTSGFYGGVIVGDPPADHTVAQPVFENAGWSTLPHAIILA